MKRSTRILFAVIIGTLVLGYFMGTPDHGPNSSLRKAAAKTDVSEFIEGLRRFQVDCGRYPITEEGLASLMKRPAAIPASSWHGPYTDMPRIPEDPWDRPYAYKCPGLHNTNGYDVYSLGPKGKGGNEAIGNWTPVEQ